MKTQLYKISLLSLVLVGICSCTPTKDKKSNDKTSNTDSIKASIKSVNKKIISLNGAITEVLYAAGLGDQIVGVDVTSTYPDAVNKATHLGHVHKLNVEAMIGLTPDLVFVKKGEVKGAILKQLRSSGTKIVKIEQNEFSVKGTEKFISSVLNAVDANNISDSLNRKLKKDYARVKELDNPPKVLFIYARGAGTLMVAGENTQMQAMIRLAGGKNAVSGFNSFKSLTPEAVVQANPDVLLMFESGKKSLQKSGVWSIPGIQSTKAGKNKNLITMDAQFLSGFGPRMGEAAYQLNQRLKKIE